MNNTFVVLSILGLINILYQAETLLLIPALGRTSDLGYFYDGNSDSFVGTRAILKSLPKNSMLPQIKSSVHVTSKIVKNLDDRLSSIGLDLKAKVSVMTGLVEVRGALSYAQESQFNSDSVYGVIHYKRLTMFETFDTRMREVQVLISMEPSSVFKATHVVTGVYSGTEIVISFESKSTASSSSAMTEIEMSASLNKLAYSVEAGIKLGSKNTSIRSETAFEIKIYSDLDIKVIPTTIEEVYELLSSVPDILEKTALGKGVPQSYELMEIEKLQSLINFDLRKRKSYISQPNKTVKRAPDNVQIETLLLSVFDKKESTLQDFYEGRSLVQNYNFLLDKSYINQVNRLYSDFEFRYLVFKETATILLQKCRHNMTQTLKKTFKRTCKEYMKHELGPKKIKAKYSKLLNTAYSKVRDFNSFTLHNVTFVKKDVTVNDIRLVKKSLKQRMLFLYYTAEIKDQNLAIWNEVSQWFVEQKGLKFVIDCNLTLHRQFSCPTRKDEILGNQIEIQDYQIGSTVHTLSFDYFYQISKTHGSEFVEASLYCDLQNKYASKDCGVFQALRFQNETQKDTNIARIIANLGYVKVT